MEEGTKVRKVKVNREFVQHVIITSSVLHTSIMWTKNVFRPRIHSIGPATEKACEPNARSS